MIYIFEDHEDADISILFKCAYNKKDISRFVFAKGNGNLYCKAKEELDKTSDSITLYIDMIPGNMDCYRIYNRLKVLSLNNNCRLIILPIICAEYYFIKSISDKEIFIDRSEVVNCINKIPHILSKIMQEDDKRRYCKNFEKYCKYIVRYGAKTDCIKPFNKEESKYGEYYIKSCLCNKSIHECVEIALKQKSINLLSEYPYVPQFSVAEKKQSISESGLWKIHQRLVIEYNNFTDTYLAYDKHNINKYKKIKTVI